MTPNQKLCADITYLLKDAMKDDSRYINPYFLTGISQLMDSYYDYEDDDLDALISDMWGH